MAKMVTKVNSPADLAAKAESLVAQSERVRARIERMRAERPDAAWLRHHLLSVCQSSPERLEMVRKTMWPRVARRGPGDDRVARLYSRFHRQVREGALRLADLREDNLRRVLLQGDLDLVGPALADSRLVFSELLLAAAVDVIERAGPLAEVVGDLSAQVGGISDWEAHLGKIAALEGEAAAVDTQLAAVRDDLRAQLAAVQAALGT